MKRAMNVIRDGQVIGQMFFCPACQTGHLCNNPAHPNERTGGKWTFNGNYDLPTFSPSVMVTYENGGVCHSHVSDGWIDYCGDCTHELKGQRVVLPDIDTLHEHPPEPEHL